MTIRYRGVYWIRSDRQATVRLTGKDQAELSDDESLALAAAEARVNELNVDGGQIAIEQSCW